VEMVVPDYWFVNIWTHCERINKIILQVTDSIFNIHRGFQTFESVLFLVDIMQSGCAVMFFRYYTTYIYIVATSISIHILSRFSFLLGC
jgi:hypothetical protein